MKIILFLLLSFPILVLAQHQYRPLGQIPNPYQGLPSWYTESSDEDDDYWERRDHDETLKELVDIERQRYELEVSQQIEEDTERYYREREREDANRRPYR